MAADVFDAAEQIWADRDALLLDIERAFAHVSREGGVSLRGARALDNYYDDDAVRAASAFDTDTRWEEVSAADLERFSDTLSFFDRIGFRYYLPAFMTWDLSQCYALGSLCFPSNLRHHLGRWGYDRQDDLDPAQRDVARRYLRFIADYGTRWESEDAWAALGDWPPTST